MSSTTRTAPQKRFRELEFETELGAPRVLANGQVTIATLVSDLPAGTDVYCADSRTTWEIIEDPAASGVRVARLVAGPGTLTGLAAIPPPRVRLYPAWDMGDYRTRSGASAIATGRLVISTEGVPAPYLLDPSLSFRVELCRYMPKRRRVVQHAGGREYRPMPQGFYHPSTWVGGVTPPAIDGTRGGSPTGVAVDRPTEWPLLGYQQNQRLELRVGDVLLPFFEIIGIDDAYGNSANALVHYQGIKRSNVRGVWSYRRQMFRAAFVFRYAVMDASSNYLVTGPYSTVVFARPARWPTNNSQPYPTPGNKGISIISPVTINPRTGRSYFEQLNAQIGGIVTGRNHS